ncbi:hypothetical protein PVAND_000660 [Polypedilum vanderplanki]|uniref:Uncharacterized protein n=1 Tax=Polypedilum vanderplanki TaxID=319348 RepID=A0A9J6BL97_POLVA|nr:hypothetical protein PVAND_000660 [Polypedilum vanderplanki]
MHIHPSSPNSLSEDEAAAKIQAGYRGYRVRKQLKNSRRMKNEQQQNGHNGVSNKNSTCDQSTLEESAVKIQKLWKGFKTRKELKCASQAATKIQASYRGFRTRRELKSKKIGSRKSQ